MFNCFGVNRFWMSGDGGFGVEKRRVFVFLIVVLFKFLRFWGKRSRSL